MRLLCLVVLVVIVAGIVAFAMQNQEAVTVQFLQYRLTYALAAVVAVAYGLGMVTGWSVVGIIRRSVARMTEPRDTRR